MRRSLIVGVTLLIALTIGLWWLLHPVCVLLSPEDVARAAEWQPLEQRTDRQLHGPVFQQRDGRWYQCKSWISRQLFF